MHRTAGLGRHSHCLAGTDQLRLRGHSLFRSQRAGRFKVFAVDTKETKKQTGGEQTKKRRGKKKDAPADFTLDPISLGRRSRQAFNDVWNQFTKLSSPTRSLNLEDGFGFGDTTEFTAPQASITRVLVAGATGRVGKVLIRKLLLRGYKVRVLVRKGKALDGIPTKVEVVRGDVGEYNSCKRAVQGVDKIICCTGARSNVTVDLVRVEQQGVANLAKAIMDYQNVRARKRGLVWSRAKKDIANFQLERYRSAWVVQQLGVQGAQASRRVFDKGQDTATVHADDESNNLVFEGAVYSRGGAAEAGAPLDMPYDETLDNCEGLIMRLRGDGEAYSFLLKTGNGSTYSARFNTTPGWQTVRLPFSSFRAASQEAPPLDPAAVEQLSLRYEPRTRAIAVFAKAGTDGSKSNSFRLELDYIKALPSGEETDFILVSCAGVPYNGMDDNSIQKLTEAKRRGEAFLRNTGLGYTVVRPGPMVEEPGGYKALVFDQGNRITQNISVADVADVCLKALHDPLARNKTFEVCYEYTPEEGLAMYELVAHLPDKANNYLSPALATLEKNS